MAKLRGKTLFITGGSRGIGRAIAVRAAQDHAQIVLVARDAKGKDLQAAAAECTALGAEVLTVAADVSAPASMKAAVVKAHERFGGIDSLINNAAALQLRKVQKTSLAQFSDLLNVNLLGAYKAVRVCLPYLKVSDNPHILNLAPPLNLNARWFETHTPYTVSKYALSLLTKGLAEELAEFGIAVNALWPRTVIYTGADFRMPGVEAKNCRTPAFVAAAAVELISRPSRAASGQFYSDEEVMRAMGVTDFKPYAIAPGEPLMADFFVS